MIYFPFGKASWDSFPNRKDIDKPSGICLFWSMAIAFTPVYSLLRTVTASMSPSKINHNLPESHIFMPLNRERLGNVVKWGHSMQQNFNLVPLRRIFFMQKYSFALRSLDQRYNKRIIKARFSLIPNNGEKKCNLAKYGTYYNYS